VRLPRDPEGWAMLLVFWLAVFGCVALLAIALRMIGVG
jgi:hypothetical protein